MACRQPQCVFLLLCVLVIFQNVESTAPGALKLDNYTIDKVLGIPGRSTLVKFDQSYAYGEKEDEFKALCKLAYSVPNLFLGEVPVQEYGDKDNDDLREKYGLKKEEFPAYFLFDEANKKGLRYSGSTTADAIATWLRQQKIKMPFAGTIADLDEVVKSFFKNGKADSEIEAAKKLAEGEFSSNNKAAWYVKIMQKIKEKGEEYVGTETKRVNKLLEGKIAAEKVLELNDKLKVLGVFASKDEL